MARKTLAQLETEIDKRVSHLEEAVTGNGLLAAMQRNTTKLDEVKVIQQQIVLAIDGGKKLNGGADDSNPGLRGRLKSVEAGVAQYAQDRDRIRWIITGIGLGTVANGGLLVTIAAKLFGGGP